MISYAITDCFLGKMLVIATYKGVCWVSFDKDRQALEAVAEKYMLAERDRPSIGRCITVPVDDVLAVVNGEERKIDLDLNGTPFQTIVWGELQKIPKGQTATYEQLAERLGRSKAIRAVAMACGQNPVAVLVPCHRAVGKKDIGGYRWGVERKIELLRREGVTV